MLAIDSINISANISDEKIHKGSALCKRHKKGTRNFYLMHEFWMFRRRHLITSTSTDMHIYIYWKMMWCLRRWNKFYVFFTSRSRCLYRLLLPRVIYWWRWPHTIKKPHTIKNLKFIMKKGIFQWNVNLQTKYIKRKNINETINSSPQMNEIIGFNQYRF